MKTADHQVSQVNPLRGTLHIAHLFTLKRCRNKIAMKINQANNNVIHIHNQDGLIITGVG